MTTGSDTERPSPGRTKRLRPRSHRDRAAYALSSSGGRVIRSRLDAGRWVEYIEPWAYQQADLVLAAIGKRP